MQNSRKLFNSRVLITGGAGFIGSNLTQVLLEQGNEVVVLDNLSTGKWENVEPFLGYRNFKFIKGDIRNLDDCKNAVKGVNIVLHHAALGSVPRSLKDPITTNDVNVSGFLNMLVACKESGIKRFVYAASSSTYGDHPDLPKVEDKIGRPLSPYAVTKFVNELYADVFAKNYGLECIGLRYFNVFGRRQSPDGAYAAVIPKFVKALINHESAVINGDGTHSRDFTYIDNVVQINQLAALTNNSGALNSVFNVAHGENTSLNQLYDYLRESLSKFDQDISKIAPIYGPERKGDIKHSQADISKASTILGYKPEINVKGGIELATNWYWDEYGNK